MKVLSAFLCLLFFACGNKQHEAKHLPKAGDSVVIKKDSVTVEQQKILIQYTANQLESFLDSIGALSPVPLADSISFMADSVFTNRTPLATTVQAADFETLKQGCKTGSLDIKTVKRIFDKIKIDSGYEETGTLPLTFVSFDKKKNDFKQFAVCPGYADAGWECDLYFFTGNKIISKHHIYHRYGLIVKHYKDADGKTVVYYKENYGSGSGIWWFNFCFYKYDDNKLIPVLNELENANLQPYWSARSLWFETTVEKTNPLTMKMVYRQSFSDTAESPDFINDSAFVRYRWDNNSKTLVGDYAGSKISRAQILTYYLEDNELLFINVYHDKIKSLLQNKNMRQQAYAYLNLVKNHYDNPSMKD